MTFETTMRPLHPQVQAFIDEADPSRPKLYELEPVAARAQAAGAAALIGPGPAVASVRDVGIPAGDVTIPARVYGPAGSQGTIVWFHGGGWVIGGLDTHDAMCRTLANAAHCTVVSVAYRLAPEHPFPAPLDDAWAALLWASAEYPSAPLVVGGDSAGGNLAAVCALRSRDRGGPALALQVLVYPVTDHDLATASYIERGGEDTMLSRRSMKWFWDQYVPDPADRANPEASPLRAPDLSGLPAAVVVTAEYDPLRDEGRAYAQRLRDAGVTVTADHYQDMAHPFFAFVNVFERSNEAVERVAERIRAAVTSAAPAPGLPRRIVNPHQGDVATFLQTSMESGGERTLLELEIAPGGRVIPHYHLSYAEHFHGREGRITVRVGDKKRTLGPGEEAVAQPGQLHAWSNETAEPAVVRVELRPGHAGFEKSLRVGYGLAADGLVRANGMPRNMLHAALMLKRGAGRLPRAYRLLEPILGLMAVTARRRGIDRELERRYLSGTTPAKNQ